MEEEKIIASAIKFFRLDDFEAQFPIIMTGKRHCDCLNLMDNFGMTYDRSTHIQGFLTNKNRFVDRIEGKKIALAAHQNIVPEEAMLQDLYSEDLW